MICFMPVSERYGSAYSPAVIKKGYLSMKKVGSPVEGAAEYLAKARILETMGYILGNFSGIKLISELSIILQLAQEIGVEVSLSELD
jgi:hypothetical protein